ncbi:hypothetical protein ACFV2S_10770 [Streptomyces sp. NPDC059695]|uniref:hypothetical protein n=1 Tax=Streptomyces sp. NPDC059695 TaxID=3346910 RepID=UPI0036859423
MRSILSPKPLLTAALGSVVVLAAAGTPSTAATPTRSSATRASAVHASAAQTVRAATLVTSPRGAEVRFLELADLIAQGCEPDVLSSVGHVASAPNLDTTLPVLVDPVPLTTAEECVAKTHQLRISKAFSGKETTTYEQMRARLTTLRYPAARIHRAPNFAGRPVARIDLRVGADHLALEVTDIGQGLMVRAFGAPQDVNVTEVLLKRQLDRPTS